jgi:Holliday junction resolvase-like predicted endonuclease
MKDKEVNAREFIEEYRLDKYKLDENGSWDRSNERIYQDLTNAVEQLSKGLYEKDVHFLLELIQNAEDNEYRESSPDLKFLLMDDDPTGTPGSDGCLCVFNNEIGFREENIESISSIGRSTKKKVEGYIGEKGIGFKSVFIVSESPHIFSNGYQIKFLENDSSFVLNYIVPYWVESVPSIVADHRVTTSLLLPLKEGKKQLIVDHLKDIQAETILFLQKLEGLTIDIEETGECIELARNNGETGVTELLVQSGRSEAVVHNYWLYDQKATVPETVKEEKREGITKRNISLALPLEPDGRSGLVYAYLPTEVDSGFPFLINADFMLTANRESIQSERPWNVWLQTEISKVVVSALIKMREEERFKEGVYGYIPLPGQTKSLPEYFGRISDLILEGLRNEQFVLSDRSTLHSASQIRQCDERFRKLVSFEVRPNWFDTHAITSPEIEKYKKQLTAIDVQPLLVSDVMEWLGDAGWLSARDVKWFAELYSTMGVKKTGSKKDLAKKLIIPVEGGGLAKADDSVFLPDDHGVFTQIINVLPAELRQSIRFVDKSFIDLISKDQGAIDWALEKLDLSEFSFDSFLEKSLLPWLNENCEVINEEFLMTVNQLIVSNWSDIEETTRESLREVMPVILDSGEIHRIDELEGDELLVPRSLDPDKGWQHLLVSEEDWAGKDVLSDSYLDLLSNDNEEVFKEFLSELCAETFPDFPLKVYSRGTDDTYANRVFASFIERSTMAIQFHTWVAPSSLKDGNIYKRKHFRSALLNWLEEMLPSHSSSIKIGVLKWFFRTNRTTHYQSSLYVDLLHSPWLKTSKGYRKPGEVFFETRQARDFFGSRLAYLDGRMSRDVAEFLGVKTDISSDSLVELLEEFSQQSSFGEEKLLERIYKYLDGLESFDPTSFQGRPLIYCESSNKKWLSVQEVVWEDSSVALGDSWGWLSSQYDSKLKGFFVDKLGVTEDVNDEAFASAWTRYQESENSAEAIEKFLELAMPRLARSLSDEAAPDWREDFSNSALAWTQNKNWQDPGGVYVADDRRLSSLFKDEVDLVWKPESRTHAYLQPIYETLGVPKISESVTYSIDESCSGEARDENTLLTERSVWLICYAICNIGKDGDALFDHLLSEGVIANLVSSQEVLVDDLVVNAEIEGTHVQAELDSVSAFLDIENSRLYIDESADEEDVEDDLAESLARIIWGSQRFKENVPRIQVLLSISKEERFRKLRDRDEWHLSRDRQSALRSLFESRTEQEEIDAGESIAGFPDAGHDDSAEDQEGGGHVDIELDGDSDGEEHSLEDSDVHTEETQEGDGSQAPDGADTSSQPTTRSGVGSVSGRDSPSPSGGRSGGGTSTGQNRAPGTSKATPRGGSGSTAKPSGRAGRARSGGIAASVNQARRNQMRSYVASELADTLDCSEASEAQEARNQLGEQGEEEVLRDLESRGFKAKRMPPNNPGYDIEATNTSTGQIVYIEVKGDSFSWSDKGVGITRTQYEKAIEKGSSFYLAVVENLRSHPRRIHYIQDPVAYITEYRFDSGWAPLASNIGQIAQRKPDMSVCEELKAYTDSESCKAVIDYCESAGYPFPDIGVPVSNDIDGVIFDDLELAWVDERFAVLPTAQLVELASEKVEGWRFLVAKEFDDVRSALDGLFDTDSKCET